MQVGNFHNTILIQSHDILNSYLLNSGRSSIAAMSLLWAWAVVIVLTITATVGIVPNEVFAASNTFSADGLIGSLVLGMPPSTHTVNMSSVDKFVLSGYWKLVTDKGEISYFTSDFYTGHVNGSNNHIHQLTNLRVLGDLPVQLTSDGSTQIVALTDVKTNGKSTWNDVPTTILISKGRTISIDIADNGTQRHFMGQPIYGIVKNLEIQQ